MTVFSKEQIFNLVLAFGLGGWLVLAASYAARAEDSELVENIYDNKSRQILPNNPRDAYIYCRLKAAMDAKRDGQDYLAARKAGLSKCQSAEFEKDKAVGATINRSVDKYYEGE